MANTYTSLHYHVIFSTKNRERWICQGIEQRVCAFTVSKSQLSEVVQYVAQQREHHKVLTFQEEYKAFLQKHGIDYDERYVWG